MTDPVLLRLPVPVGVEVVHVADEPLVEQPRLAVGCQPHQLAGRADQAEIEAEPGGLVDRPDHEMMGRQREEAMAVAEIVLVSMMSAPASRYA